MQSVLKIFCGFDGTVIQEEPLQFLLRELGYPQGVAIETARLKGELSTQEALKKQVQLIQEPGPVIYSALQRVQLDPSFICFAKWCMRKNVPLIIVSESLEQIIRILLEQNGIQVTEIWANRLNRTNQGEIFIDYPLPPTQKHCSASLCKCRLLTPKTCLSHVIIGNELYDPCWLEQADLIFAKASLQTYCQRKNMSFKPFYSFETVQREIEMALGQIRNIKWKPEPCLELTLLNPLASL